MVQGGPCIPWGQGAHGVPARRAEETEGVRRKPCERTPTTLGLIIRPLSNLHPVTFTLLHLPSASENPPSFHTILPFPPQTSLYQDHTPTPQSPAPAHPCLLQNCLGLGLLGCHHGALVTPTAAKPELGGNGRFKFPSRKSKWPPRRRCHAASWVCPGSGWVLGGF